MPGNKNKSKKKGITKKVAAQEVAIIKRALSFPKLPPPPKVGRVKGLPRLKSGLPMPTVQAAPSRVGTRLSPYSRSKVASNGNIIMCGLENFAPNIQTNAGTAAGSILQFGSAGNLQDANFNINPLDEVSFATRITNVALSYQHWKVNKMGFIWVPSVGTATNGQIILAFDYDVDGVTPDASYEGVRTYSQFKHNILASVWQTEQMAIGGQSESPYKRYYTHSEETLNQRESYHGQLYVVSGGGLPINTTVGAVYIEYEIEFETPMYTNPAAPSGVQTNTAVYPLGGATNQNALGVGTSGYATTGRNAKISQAPDGSGLAIQLDPGVYLVEGSAFLNYLTTAGGGFAWGTPQIIQSPFQSGTQVATISSKRRDSSNIPAGVAAGTGAAGMLDIIQVPNGGAWYRPTLTNPVYTSGGNSAITFNLEKVAASIVSYIAGLFASPLEQRRAWFEHQIQAQIEHIKRGGDINRRFYGMPDMDMSSKIFETAPMMDYETFVAKFMPRDEPKSPAWASPVGKATNLKALGY